MPTTTDGDHGHPISSPCEPNGSGELKIHLRFLRRKHFIGSLSQPTIISGLGS